MRPATTHLRAIRSLRCLMPFNGLGIMVCALLSLDIMSLLFMVLAASYLPVIFLGKSNAVILCDLYKSPNQDPSVCRPLHTESLCFQVSSDRFS